jgi:hypothetical protein
LERLNIEINELCCAQASRIGGFEDGPITQVKRRHCWNALEQSDDLVSPQNIRQMSVTSWSRQKLGRVLFCGPLSSQRTKEGPEGSESPRNRRWGQTLSRKHSNVAPELAGSDLSRTKS